MVFVREVERREESGGAGPAGFPGEAEDTFPVYYW
jgi:hypothetical protein